MTHSLSHKKPLDIGDVGIAPDQLPPFDGGLIDLAAWFAPAQRTWPLELEIGSGKGTFLVKEATARPQVNYIGLEYTRAYWRYAADRIRRHGLTNVKLVHAEAGFFLRNYVPHRCLSQVHIYFPDPWPKKRHHKRRLIQAPLLAELHRILVEPADGCALVRIATDHEDYHRWILHQVAQVADMFDKLPFQSPSSAGQEELVGTNFELKYRHEGRPIHAMILRKRPTQSL